MSVADPEKAQLALNLIGIRTGLVYLTWTTLSFQSGILMGIRGKGSCISSHHRFLALPPCGDLRTRRPNQHQTEIIPTLGAINSVVDCFSLYDINSSEEQTPM